MEETMAMTTMFIERDEDENGDNPHATVGSVVRCVICAAALAGALVLIAGIGGEPSIAERLLSGLFGG
jgi:hypothetical protein